MNKKHFNAILAKNRIASELKEYHQNGEQPSYLVMVDDLLVIEKQIGEGNQPSVKEILKYKN